MTATDTREPDLLDLLAMNASVSLTTAGRIRAAWLEAVQTIADQDGDFDSGRVRAWLDGRDMKWAHGSESGATMTSLVRTGAAEWTGDMAELGNTEQRAGGRLVKVYRLTARVWHGTASA